MWLASIRMDGFKSPKVRQNLQVLASLSYMAASYVPMAMNSVERGKVQELESCSCQGAASLHVVQDPCPIGSLKAEYGSQKISITIKYRPRCH